MIKKLAAAYWWPDRILIHPSNRTESGFFIGNSPYIKLSTTATDIEVGNAICNALEAFKSGISNPDYSSDSYNQSNKDYLKSAGASSLKAFMKDAKHVSISEDGDNKIHFVPTENGGSAGEQKGFSHLPKLELIISKESDPKDIGAKLIEAWSRCL